MIKTHSMLIDELSQYAAPNNKIMRMVKQKGLIPLNKGIYETDPNAPATGLAASIYGPSYISFEYALAYYDLIPERVNAITSATFEKNRCKQFENPFGVFTYRDVPSNVFPLGLTVQTQDGYSYRIACAEKALCDQLYKISPVGSVKQLKTLIFDDLRVDHNAFYQLDQENLKDLASRYRRTNLRLLCKLIERGK